nr:HTH domain-containing protein [Microbacterium sp. W4I4]
MSRQRQDQLLAVLLRQDSWATASSLADQLGVTPRSIRSYVAAPQRPHRGRRCRRVGSGRIPRGPARRRCRGDTGVPGHAARAPAPPDPHAHR